MGVSLVAPEVPVLAVGETRNFSVSFADQLDEGELLNGTPVIIELTTSDLGITNERVNTAAMVFSEHTIAIGKGVQFSVSGQLTDVAYSIKITATSDGVPNQILIRGVDFTAEGVT
ncbi:hypothetical protein LCGC14_2403000 [marine sediment metagenome]|uniref:SbsA Ig-like domain-containing protein n=1 Tax=marine sediment metagenome TaxID=412755 RepID=A0A0F9CGT9_9ZZZZ